MKKDLVAVLGCAVLLAIAFAATRGGGEGSARAAADPYATDGREVSIRYRWEGGLSPLEFAEVEVAGPGSALVRYKGHGKLPVERAVPVGEATWSRLLDLLREADFFGVEPRRRTRLIADYGVIQVAVSIGDRSHTVAIDGRTEPDRPLDDLLAIFGGLLDRAQGKRGA